MVQVKDPAIYDTSHWKVIPDFALVDPPPRLVLTKATEGTSYVDPTFVPYFRDLLQDGIRRGCFHFFRKAQNALDQAKHFCNTIRPHITKKDILVLDVEEGGETAAMLRTWLEYVRSQFPNNLILIYSRKNILEAIPTFLRSSLNVRWLAEKAAPYLPAVILKALDYTFAKVQNRNSILNAIPMTMAERALFHFLYWRTTAPRVMDIFLTDDSRLLTEAAALGAKLWVQMQEFAFNTILANLGVNRYGQLFCDIDPQIIPEDERSGIPVVMEIEKRDWQEVIPLPRVVVNDTGLVDVSGVSVNTSANGLSFFSLAPGNVQMRYGDDFVADHLAAIGIQNANSNGPLRVRNIDGASETNTPTLGASAYISPSIYLMIQRDSTTNYTTKISSDGITWTTIGSFSEAGTIANISILMDSQGGGSTNGSMTVDFIRFFTSQTEVIGNVPA